MKLLIKSGTVINSDGRRVADVLVNNGQIEAVEENIAPGAHEEIAEVVDASGLFVLPGAIDVHTHFQLPFGDISSADDFFTGTRAAACGGVTTVIDFVSPESGESLMGALEKRKAEANEKVCIDYGLHICLSDIFDRGLIELTEVVKAGVTSFKIFMTYASRVTDGEFRRTLEYARHLRALVMVHAEDHDELEANRAKFIAEGKTDAWHHYLSRPEIVEAKAVKKAIELTKEVGASLYIVHLACADGLEAVRQVQAESVILKNDPSATHDYNVYAETCPQYLKFTYDVYKRPDGRNFVCSPPMKGMKSRKALWESVKGKSGINTIATDHCPFKSTEKDRGIDDFTKIPNGVMGVENLYPYMLSEANNKNLTFERVVELCSANPAAIFGIPCKGKIAPGFDADIVLYDTKKDFTISQSNMHSNIDYTIWEGVALNGYPVKTYSRGELVYDNGEFKGKAGAGRFIERT